MESMNKGIIADHVALPFWVVLLIYSYFEITKGNSRAWLVAIIVGIAFIVDLILVIEYWKNKKRKK